MCAFTKSSWFVENCKRKDTVCVVVNKDFIQKEDKLTLKNSIGVTTKHNLNWQYTTFSSKLSF